jgi:hypothetical protein
MTSVRIRAAGYVTAIAAEAVCDPRRVARSVSLGDHRLVEWVAQASVGDGFPEPYCWARNPLQSVILTLTDLGVMDRPAPGAEWAQIAEEATASAQVWLQKNAPPPGW